MAFVWIARLQSCRSGLMRTLQPGAALPASQPMNTSTWARRAILCSSKFHETVKQGEIERDPDRQGFRHRHGLAVALQLPGIAVAFVL